MAFLDIYNDFASLVGITDPTKKNFLRGIINRAAEDLYSQSDLVNSLREQVFVRDSENLPQPTLQYTLPWYVWKLRGMREYNSGLGILNHDMRPRYQVQGWREFIDPFLYRVKENVLLARHILNEGPLTFNLPDGETSDAVINLWASGSNNSRSRFQESVVFAVGDTGKTTSQLFSTVDGIRKAAATTFDLYVLDADGNTVSFIPNTELIPRYTLIQVSDVPYWNPEYIEVLYKIRFTPFVNDYDEFPCTNIYDKAIVYKACEHYYISQRKDFDTAAKFFTKCCEVVKNISTDFSDNNEKVMDFGQNQYLNMVPSTITRTPLNPFFRMHRPL